MLKLPPTKSLRSAVISLEALVSNIQVALQMILGLVCKSNTAVKSITPS